MPMLGVRAINLLEMSEGPGLESNHVEVEAVQGICSNIISISNSDLLH